MLCIGLEVIRYQFVCLMESQFRPVLKYVKYSELWENIVFIYFYNRAYSGWVR